jgi:cytochrome oxidase assembly protein ShyY1
MPLSRSFKFNWKMSLFSVLFFVLFVNLGSWQLDRADEKEAILETEKLRQNQPPVSFSTLQWDSELSGLPVRAGGIYEPEKSFLLDNRVLEGRVGFEVLVPFRTDDDQLLLVNRGFVPMGRTRQELPETPELIASPGIVGKLYKVQANTMTPEESTTISWPMIVQSTDPVILQGILGEDLYPYVVRLALKDDNALPRYWPSTLILPAKHTGYAVQWFSMAITIALAYLFFSFRKEDG